MKIFVIVLFLVVSCNSNQKRKEKIKKDNCKEFNDKYLEYVTSNMKDSAIYYIDKAIFCDPKDDFFKSEKIRLLLKYENYSSATEYVKELSSDGDITYKMLYGVLLLKEESITADSILEDSYILLSEETKNYNNDNSNLHFYRLGLDNYFKGTDYTLERIKEFKSYYTTEHDVQLADYIENLIINESSKKVLFKLFNIK